MYRMSQSRSPRLMMITKRGLEQGYCSISDGGLRTFYLRASGTEGWELSAGNAGRGEDCGAIGSYRTREAWRTPRLSQVAKLTVQLDTCWGISTLKRQHRYFNAV